MVLIERRLTPYVVHGDEPLARALEKITANRARVIFVVSEHGHLEGVLSDGDFRRWAAAQHDAGTTGPDLSVPARLVANRSFRSAPEHTTPAAVRHLFGDGVDHVPLLDPRGRLVAIAVRHGDEVRLGRHVVARDRPAVLVSEIGINHQGSVAFAKELVERSVQAGADMVKFQLRDLDALYRRGPDPAGGEDLGPQYTLDLLKRFNLGADALFEVFEHCHSLDVDVMCTPWDPPSVDRLAAYRTTDDPDGPDGSPGLAGLKVASADLTNHDLLRRMADTGIAMVVSTGMASETEIREAVAVLRAGGASYSLLHCQSTYPAPYKDVNLRYLTRLAEIGQCPVGYSGHERGFHVPLAAVAMGAKVIEKHFTTDRSLEGNDHRVSLLPDEFAEMVVRVREVEEALGSAAPRTVSTGEMMNRINLAKSLVAVRRVEVGETITRDVVTVRSPGRGLQPNALDRLVGRTARRVVEAGDFFYPGDLGAGSETRRTHSFRRPWGLPVRYHDHDRLVAGSNPDFVEFHFSYADLDLDPAEVLTGDRTTAYEHSLACHAPDLYAGDFLLDLASPDDAHWERSIAELQRVVDTTRRLRPWFAGGSGDDPVVIASLGGFTHDRHLGADDLAPRYERVADGLKRVDDAGVRLCAQTLPPYPWYFGGQLFCNLFVDPRDTADFARTYDRRLTLDVSHTKLASTFLGLPFAETVALLGPWTEHLHLVDARGVDGEGVQVGDGEIDWSALAVQLDDLAPRAGFIPEIWQGHVDDGAGFWTALDRLERWF